MKRDLYKLVPLAPAVAVALALYVFVSTAYASDTERASPTAFSEARKDSTADKWDDWRPFAMAEDVMDAKTRSGFGGSICGSAHACSGSFADTPVHTRSSRDDLSRSTDGRDHSSSDFAPPSSDSGLPGIAAAGPVDEHPLASSPSLVPEPETYAMLMVGLGLMGVMARRRHHD